MSSKIFVKVESSMEQQENLRNSRKSLKVLQRASTDKENLVGRQVIGGGPHKSFVKSKSENDFNDTASDIKRKKLATQIGDRPPTAPAASSASTGIVKPKRRSSELLRIVEEDLTQTDDQVELSAAYWRDLAERRRVALDVSLSENQELHELNASLKEQLDVSNQMLDESRNLVEILTEMLEEGDSAGMVKADLPKADDDDAAGEFGESSKSCLQMDAQDEAEYAENDDELEAIAARTALRTPDMADDEDSHSDTNTTEY